MRDTFDIHTRVDTRHTDIQTHHRFPRRTIFLFPEATYRVCLFDGKLHGVSIDGGRGREDKVLDAVLLHGLEEVDGSRDVVVVVR